MDTFRHMHVCVENASLSYRKPAVATITASPQTTAEFFKQHNILFSFALRCVAERYIYVQLRNSCVSVEIRLYAD